MDDISKLKRWKKKLDYMIATIPYQYDVAVYTSVVKPYGTYTQVGMPVGLNITINNFYYLIPGLIQRLEY